MGEDVIGVQIVVVLEDVPGKTSAVAGMGAEYLRVKAARGEQSSWCV